MARVTIGGIIRTSIVTAFTIAAALIWKDVIIELIELIFPTDQLFYKFIAAIFATFLVIIAIYIIFETQKETEVVLKKFKDGKKANLEAQKEAEFVLKKFKDGKKSKLGAQV